MYIEQWDDKGYTLYCIAIRIDFSLQVGVTKNMYWYLINLT